jgi:hypothetical protein
MSIPSCASYVVVLNQQRQQQICEHNECDDASVDRNKKTNKNCTVVENGRVVVKPLQPEEELKETSPVTHSPGINPGAFSREREIAAWFLCRFRNTIPRTSRRGYD